MPDNEQQKQQQQPSPEQLLSEMLNAISITPDAHKQIVESPEAMTKAFVDLVATAVYTCWKEVDKWVLERSRDIVPLQFAALLIEIMNPNLHGREAALLKAIMEEKRKNPQQTFVRLVDAALQAIQPKPKDENDAG